MTNLLIRNRRIILKGLEWNTISSRNAVLNIGTWIKFPCFFSAPITFLREQQKKGLLTLKLPLKAKKKFIQSRFSRLKNLPGVNGTISGFLSKVLSAVGGSFLRLPFLHMRGVQILDISYFLKAMPRKTISHFA